MVWREITNQVTGNSKKVLDRIKVLQWWMHFSFRNKCSGLILFKSMPQCITTGHRKKQLKKNESKQKGKEKVSKDCQLVQAECHLCPNTWTRQLQSTPILRIKLATICLQEHLNFVSKVTKVLAFKTSKFSLQEKVVWKEMLRV